MPSFDKKGERQVKASAKIAIIGAIILAIGLGIMTVPPQEHILTIAGVVCIFIGLLVLIMVALRGQK